MVPVGFSTVESFTSVLSSHCVCDCFCSNFQNPRSSALGFIMIYGVRMTLMFLALFLLNLQTAVFALRATCKAHIADNP